MTAFPDIPAPDRRRIARIVQRICREHSVSPSELESPARSRRIVRARMLAMTVIRAVTGLPYARIANLFRRADAGSVCGQIRDLRRYRERWSEAQALILRFKH